MMDTPYEKLLANLARAEVKFIVVGGVAVALNGFVRTTDDVDILIERSQENVQRLLEALASFGAGHAAELSLQDFGEEEGAVRVIEEFPLDIFTVMRGHSYHDLVGRVRETSIRGRTIHFLDAEGLIRLKRDSAREKDQIDISALRKQIQEAGGSATS
jgi:predicted nucleotidyltransferase